MPADDSHEISALFSLKINKDNQLLVGNKLNFKFLFFYCKFIFLHKSCSHFTWYFLYSIPPIVMMDFYFSSTSTCISFEFVLKFGHYFFHILVLHLTGPIVGILAAFRWSNKIYDIISEELGDYWKCFFKHG